MMTMLDKAAVTYQVVLTKADKVKADALAEVVAGVAAEAARHVAAHPEILPTSSETGLGIVQLRAGLTALAQPAAGAAAGP